MKAKKSYGQHFLHREDIAERIALSLEHTDRYEHLIEIGPGKGVLSKYLLPIWGDQLRAIEADQDMVDYLAKHYPSLQVIYHDFLKIWLNRVFDEGQPFAIIGNFPYNISSQIVFRILEHRSVIAEMVGMFQKEMAQRIIAEPGSKTYGVISVLTQAYYEGTYLFSVKPGAFQPPPKVMSAVIRLSRKEDHELGCDYKMFRRVVKAAFGQRRKMLRNTMKPLIPQDILMADSFYQLRPERLSVQDFVALTLEAEKYNE